ncbi:MOSC and FAD-binding oxidoreductase domain-containing protein [soil metagenome]
MATLVSVNVGLPKDVHWQDKTVHTGIWKAPVDGPVMVRRLNIDGDGQGDLGGHGGEQRAVLVYQSESYRYWQAQLGRDDLRPGDFGENFTVTGMADHEVCIGDRYRIGEAEFEVTQPRVTCFRVGLRLREPEMPNLLVAHHRPGFYCRVITEGHVRTGDDIVLTARGRHQISVAAIDGLLYLPEPDTDRLHAAVDVPALSPGWRQSFAEMLSRHDTPAGPAWSGFRGLRVSRTHRESPDVLSIHVESDDGTALPRPLPGQYLTVRLPEAGDPAPLRSYSLSGDPGAGAYRISVKREGHGQVSRWLHDNVRAGSLIEAAAPRGEFSLTDGSGPVVLLSAGVGITPVLAMLHALATSRNRSVTWVHTTRSRESHAFAQEVTDLISALPLGTQHTFYTADGTRLGPDTLVQLQLPPDADVYLCGPNLFMDAMRSALVAGGHAADRLHVELFGTLPSINPGVVGAPVVHPHLPAGPAGSGPPVTMSRSGITANWSSDYGSLLDFAEACDVPTRFSCRSGVCHTCVTGIVSGAIAYTQQPLQLPAPGNVLVCCAVPDGDLVLDQ